MKMNEADNRITFSLADLEQAISDGSLAKEKDPRFDTPVSIHVRSIRSRLCDADGISAKAAIDGIVHMGILRDDSPNEVIQVSYSQKKITS